MTAKKHLLIQGGTVICPANRYNHLADIAIAAGKIVAIGHIPQSFIPDEIINATGWHIIPGLVDLRASLREPGFEHKGTIATETHAAAAGGITTLCCLPDTQPILDNAAVAELVQQRARDAGYCRVLPIGALTRGLSGDALSEMASLKSAGCVALANTGKPIIDTQLLKNTFDYAATFGMPVFFDPLDAYLSAGRYMHEGVISAQLGIKGIPDCAETVAVAKAIALQKATGVRLHLCGISSAESLPLIADAKNRGQQVTADVAIYHLWLTDANCRQFDSRYHVIPPLRDKWSQSSLRQALAEGVIDALTSSHAPHEAGAKEKPFMESSPGISGLENLLSLSLKLSEMGNLSIERIIALLTHKPAGLIQQALGVIEVGAAADLCLYDPVAKTVVDPSVWHSVGKNTPFEGESLPGSVKMTIYSGDVVYKNI